MLRITPREAYLMATVAHSTADRLEGTHNYRLAAEYYRLAEKHYLHRKQPNMAAQMDTHAARCEAKR